MRLCFPPQCSHLIMLAACMNITQITKDVTIPPAPPPQTPKVYILSCPFAKHIAMSTEIYCYNTNKHLQQEKQKPT